ncbi:MAG: hypothetical protein KDI19_08460 [Pseudomonadales bacterium]|nr:hypothetical protein [Pseudomonadales bacterium]
MLLVKPPDKQKLRSVIAGLVDGNLAREEVESWYRAVVAEYGDVDLSVKDGYWYFHSLSALVIPIALGDDETWFLRPRDLREYLHDLDQVASSETWHNITRVRAHQVEHFELRWPLIMFEHSEPAAFDRVGLTPVRGIFDVHHDLVEHTHLLYKGDLYLMVRQYDDLAHQVMLLGNNRDEAQLREFIAQLEIA